MMRLSLLGFALAATLSADNFIYLDGSSTQGEYHPYAPKVSEPTATVNPAPASKTSGHGYFIQTGAYKMSKNAKVHEGLMQNTFADVQTFKVGSYYKVMIGPYTSEKAAKRDLSAVRHVSRGAFLTRR